MCGLGGFGTATGQSNSMMRISLHGGGCSRGGAVTSLDGTQIAARVAAPDGRALQVGLALRVDPAAGSASGTVQVTPA